MRDAVCDNSHHAHVGRRAFPCNLQRLASGVIICISDHHCHPERATAIDTWGALALIDTLLQTRGRPRLSA